MIQLTTPTQQALARIATAPATSEQCRRSVPARDRLALAACPMPRNCPQPCETCSTVACRVAVELVRVVRENHIRQEDLRDG
jgi:hypothetical protein